MGHRDQTQVTTVGWRHLSLLSHRASAWLVRCCFETGPPWVALAGLEFTLLTKLRKILIPSLSLVNDRATGPEVLPHLTPEGILLRVIF